MRYGATVDVIFDGNNIMLQNAHLHTVQVGNQKDARPRRCLHIATKLSSDVTVATYRMHPIFPSNILLDHNLCFFIHKYVSRLCHLSGLEMFNNTEVDGRIIEVRYDKMG